MQASSLSYHSVTSKLCDLLGEDSSDRLKALLNEPEAANGAHFLRIEVNLCTAAGYELPDPHEQAGLVVVRNGGLSFIYLRTDHPCIELC